MLKLNLGAGPRPIEGYVNIDIAYLDDDGKFKLRQGDVSDLSMWADGEVDEVRASHVLEHLPMSHTAKVLREWIRVLKPGGVLKVAVPDFVWIARKLLDFDTTDSEGALLAAYLMGGQTDERDYHKAVFEWNGLAGAFASLGLIEVDVWESEINDCASLPVSLNVRGVKPITKPEQIDGAPTDPRLEKATLVELSNSAVSSELPEVPSGMVHAIMTCPRLGFTEVSTCINNALLPSGIRLSTVYGVFWPESLERGFESIIDSFNPKYLMTIDYDTVFSPWDVRALYATMEANPEIGALCALQMRRESGTVLVGLEKSADGSAVARVDLRKAKEDTLRVATGHFGLTIIRASCLGNIPHPWFHAVPDDEGKWGDGRIDADVAFWKAFGAAGHILCQANRVVVGHLELGVTWPDRHWRPITQPLSDYHAYGKPPSESNVWR